MIVVDRTTPYQVDVKTRSGKAKDSFRWIGAAHNQEDACDLAAAALRATWDVACHAVGKEGLPLPTILEPNGFEARVEALDPACTAHVLRWTFRKTLKQAAGPFAPDRVGSQRSQETARLLVQALAAQSWARLEHEPGRTGTILTHLNQTPHRDSDQLITSAVIGSPSKQRVYRWQILPEGVHALMALLTVAWVKGPMDQGRPDETFAMTRITDPASTTLSAAQGRRLKASLPQLMSAAMAGLRACGLPRYADAIETALGAR